MNKTCYYNLLTLTNITKSLTLLKCTLATFMHFIRTETVYKLIIYYSQNFIFIIVFHKQISSIDG